MDMHQPPEKPAIEMMILDSAKAAAVTVKIPQATEVLAITADGVMEKNGRPIDQLSKEELISLVNELVDLISKR